MVGSTSQKLQLKLLVADLTSEKQRGILVKQIALLHPTQEETDVTVLVWDGTDSPHSFAGRGIRLYAASAVSEVQTTDAAVIAWQRNWRIVPRGRVAGTLFKQGERWTPMFVCLTGVSGMEPNCV